MELAITGFINFCTSLMLGVFVLIKNPKSKRNRGFFYECFSMAFFSFSYFMWQLSTVEEDAIFWMRFVIIGLILITVVFLRFVFTMLDVIDKKKKELSVFYIINIIFIIMNFTPVFYSNMELRGAYGFWPVFKPLFYLFIIFWNWECLYSLWWLLKGLKESKGILREQIKLFTIAYVIALIGGSINILMYYNINVQLWGNISLSIFVAIIAYIIVRYRFLDIRVAFTNVGIFLLIYTLVLGIPIFTAVHEGAGFVSYLTLFVMATAGPLAYRYIQSKAENVLFARQKGYQKFIHEASRIIVREHDLNRLTKLIVYMITRTVRIKFAVVFLVDNDDGDYKLRSWRGAHPFPDGYEIPRSSHFIDMIMTRGRPFIVGRDDFFPGLSGNEPVHVVVPCLIEKKLLGFLLLGEKSGRSFYTPDDLSAFDLLSKETALAVENCNYIEENKKFQERLFRAEKLSIIGGMAEGIAHQIKNRLNYFSLAASGIHMEVDSFFNRHADLADKNPDLKNTFTELEKISRSLVENVRKTDDVVNKIIAYARIEERDSAFSEFSFDSVLDLAASLAHIKHDYKESPIKIELEEPDIIYGIKSQILESIFNILDNSYEAIEEKMMYRLGEEESRSFEPIINVKLTQSQKSSIISIYDNGVGITEENKNKVFAPYFTTKASFKSKAHTGIGMYVMCRIIEENHKGKIWFESEYMKGATFYIELPKKNV